MAKILLVENDPLQGFLRKSILERRFPEVERVADATEALCLVEQPQFAGNLGLVICGVHLPGFGGPAFVTELRERMPRLPVLVLGGASEAAGDYVGDGVRFLARPNTSDEMLTLASQMLGQDVPAPA
ncbi:MAG: response regulator [Terracidiphilus sp.]|jgi:CheY-like chemotaxis protein